MPLAAKLADSVIDALDAAMRRFEIDTPPRMAAFTAQLAHESGQLQRWTENLNYRWERLRQVFPKYFTSDAQARAFDRKPERIANRVYASRMGNGPEAERRRLALPRPRADPAHGQGQLSRVRIGHRRGPRR